MTATVGAARKKPTMGASVLCTGFHSAASTASTAAAASDIRKHIRVRSRLMPTARQNPSDAPRVKKLSSTSPGMGSTRGLPLIAAAVAHTASIMPSARTG